MNRAWKTLSGYFWWTYDRGSFHYDVMVTLILAFIFLAPFKVNFKDKPAPAKPHLNQVVVYPDGQGGMVYEVSADSVKGMDDAKIRADLLRAIQPVAGAVTLLRYEAVRDKNQQTLSYRAWVRR
jgi:hypothetical protein